MVFGQVMTAKVLIIVLFVLTVASGLAGLYFYYSYINPINVLASKNATLFDVLSRLDYMEYKEYYNNTVYLFKVDNDPQSSSGVIEVYSGDNELLYKIMYRYNESTLTSASIEYPNGTKRSLELDEYRQEFLTSIKLYRKNNLTETLEPGAGVGPVYLPYFLSEELIINWGAITDPRAQQPSTIARVDVVPATVTYMGEEVNGARVVVAAINPLLVASLWGLPQFDMEIVVDNDMVIVSKCRVDMVTQTGKFDLTIEIVNIQFT
ncbi:MAG: hypothetical protein F7C81_06545 [Desulfurococcales archaeon]|nr:hypothetical protein [Desulfurococcales archaeon]